MDGSFEVMMVKPRDRDQLERVARFLRQHAPPGSPFPGAELSAMQHDLEGNRLHVIYAVDGQGNIAGHVSLCIRNEFCGRTGYASLLLVREDCRGQNLALELLGRLKVQAQLSGCGVIETVCMPQGPARSLITRLGYRLIGSSDRHWELRLRP